MDSKRFRCITCGAEYDENPVECPSCRQTDFEDRNPEQKRKSKIIAIRLNGEEVDRFDWLVGRARKKNHLADKASVARELIGFPAIPQTVTEEDRKYFITGLAIEAEQPPAAGKLTRSEHDLFSKLKDLLLYGGKSGLAENYKVAIKGNINSMWRDLVRHGPPPSEPGLKPVRKKPKSDKTRPLNVRDRAPGDLPPPG